jgi:hypothetical protein
LHMFQVTAQTRSRVGSAFLETRGFGTPGGPVGVETRGPGGALAGFVSGWPRTAARDASAPSTSSAALDDAPSDDRSV